MPELGATVAGFRVAEVHPEEMLLLTGRHRFSSYALQFVVETHDGATQLRALTYATFPGLLGAAYRAVVITSGAITWSSGACSEGSWRGASR